jgi:transcriptional regulator with AAA-type ATPase domain
MSDTRWRLVISQQQDVVMRLPLREGTYLLSAEPDAELRLLDIEGELTVDADHVTLKVGDTVTRVDTQPHLHGVYSIGAERSETASGQTRSMMHDVSSPRASAVALVDPNGRRTPLKDQPLRIGVSSECDIVLSSGYVSQAHCTVFPKNGRIYVRDLGSKNGTYLNDVRIVEAEVAVPAVLRVGDVPLQIVSVQVMPATGFIGASDAATHVVQEIQRYAKKRAPVLIEGEAGTGKQLAARMLHEESQRAKRPFIVLDCDASTPEMLERELFGHVKGVFGSERRLGALLQADGGTLLLSEVGEMPQTLQTPLLRALESQTVKAIGEDHPRKVDVRVIATSHKHLPAAVKRGAFREDLYHHLSMLTLTLPPLRERAGDAALLAEHFLRALSPEGRVLRFSAAALTAIASHPFSGNLRELRNVTARAVLAAGPSGVIDEEMLGLSLKPFGTGKVAALASTERDAILHALRAAKGSRLHAARALKIARSTLYRKLDEHGIDDAEILGTKR